MAKIKWSKDAFESLKDIYDNIAKDSKQYAQLFCERILELVEHLEFFPEIGKSVPESNNENVREIIFKNYRIIYQVYEDYLEILLIIHGSRLINFTYEDRDN